jgi:hypothetical protein
MPVTLMRLPPEIRSTCDLPAGFKVESLGPAAQMTALIVEEFPGADLSGESGIVVNSDGARTYLVLQGDPVEAIVLQGGPRSVAQALCKRIGCRAFDASTGEVINFS